MSFDLISLPFLAYTAGCVSQERMDLVMKMESKLEASLKLLK